MNERAEKNSEKCYYCANKCRKTDLRTKNPSEARVKKIQVRLVQKKSQAAHGKRISAAEKNVKKG